MIDAAARAVNQGSFWPAKETRQGPERRRLTGQVPRGFLCRAARVPLHQANKEDAA